MNICSTLCSSSVNKRLSRWVQEKEILRQIQAGFRKDHSAIDHIFAPLAMIQKYVSKKKKLYVAFIDFRKAFDFISYCKLWPIWHTKNMKGKMPRTINPEYL